MTRPRRKGGQGQLRIIGGRWRGRKLHFKPLVDLRPTTDRARETLFNWLAPTIHDSRCLDLFAGSGALGLEALSRGAAHCQFVELAPAALAQIRDHLATLGAGSLASCYESSAERFLGRATGQFDIVFLDPPFSQPLVTPACQLLDARNLLAPEAAVYVETAAATPAPEVPETWEKHREKISGGVAYRLYHAH